MTDTEMAEEYFKKLGEKKIPFTISNVNKEIKQAFLAGLEAGRPQWYSPDEHIDKDKVVLGVIKHCNKLR